MIRRRRGTRARAARVRLQRGSSHRTEILGRARFERRAVEPRRRGHVVGALEPPLDLEGRDAQLGQLGHERARLQILRATGDTRGPRGPASRRRRPARTAAGTPARTRRGWRCDRRSPRSSGTAPSTRRRARRARTPRAARRSPAGSPRSRPATARAPGSPALDAQRLRAARTAPASVHVICVEAWIGERRRDGRARAARPRGPARSPRRRPPPRTRARRSRALSSSVVEDQRVERDVPASRRARGGTPSSRRARPRRSSWRARAR